MAMTIDHLRVDHRVTVLRAFTDAAGVTMREGERGVIRSLSFDQIRRDITIEIEREAGIITLRFLATATAGPYSGRMRDFFELGEDVSIPRVLAGWQPPGSRTMLIPPRQFDAGADGSPARFDETQSADPDGRIEEAEAEIRRQVPHIGAAASIAEMYARRMRAFQRAGDEPRAIAAFKLAVDWMGTYAGWATSGGEGAALSYERDQFHTALVREFGYDPTATNRE